MTMPDWKTVPITDHDLGHGLHMIESFGGNVGVLSTPDGTVIVDAEYPDIADRLHNITASFSNAPVRFLIETHFHWDHSGGASRYALEGATIIGSEETRRYLLEAQNRAENRPGEFPKDPLSLPSVALQSGAAIVLHVGKQTVEVRHLPSAHTDGDLLIRFVEADVIQTGDSFFKGFYPYIDVRHGGTIDGMIALCDTLARMAGPNTKIIPGHGAIATRADAVTYGTMLRTVRARVQAGITQGLTIEQLIAKQPLADLDPQYGGNLIKAPTLLRLVYDDLTRKKG
ncbi:MBL fold metallo-hydrolase [Novosphingobium sp. BL-52-GroH]|uniref:MBL fold metallo-hydrolase n=1 Tax=Novosphingobium sp. BL-52-GroH TaxID=3349877 RepID=UPI00384B2F5C